MQYAAQVGSGVDISDGEVAGLLLFVVAVAMGPFVAVLTSSLVKGMHEKAVRLAQAGGIASFLVTAVSLLIVFAFDLDSVYADALFTLSGFSAIVFVIIIVMLMVHAFAIVIRRQIGDSDEKVHSKQRKTDSRKR